MFRAFAIVLGIVIAAVGGAIAYRALFLDPSAAVVITSSGEVREVPNYTRAVIGSVLFVAGAAIAFLTALRKAQRPNG